MSDELKTVIDGQPYWHYSLLSKWEKNDHTRFITTDNFQKLVATLQREGIKEPFKIDDQGVVYDGNHRLRALHELIGKGVTKAENGKDLTYVPVFVQHPTTEAQKWNIAISGNSSYAAWDAKGLTSYLPEFETEVDISLLNMDFDVPSGFDEQVGDEKTSKPKGKKQKDVTCPECGHRFTV